MIRRGQKASTCCTVFCAVANICGVEVDRPQMVAMMATGQMSHQGMPRISLRRPKAKTMPMGKESKITAEAMIKVSINPPQRLTLIGVKISALPMILQAI